MSARPARRATNLGAISPIRSSSQDYCSGKWSSMAVLGGHMQIAERQVATAELSINYLRAGAGPPLVLLHGWPEFCRVWRKNIPALAEQFDVIAPDLRGF